MLNATELAEELYELTAWQKTPELLGDSDYLKMVVRGVRRFFRDINHPEEYDITLWINDNGVLYYDRDFLIDEVEYILILCRTEFFQRVQLDVNNAMSYKTDALTVSNADKPFANLQNTLNDLDNERRMAFHKMTRYSLGEA